LRKCRPLLNYFSTKKQLARVEIAEPKWRKRLKAKTGEIHISINKKSETKKV